MNIGELAKSSGVNAKLIRHYEAIGLIPKAARSDSGYRQYGDNDIHVLRFVKRCRSLGFSMKEIKKLISLWKNQARASSDVKDLAQAHISQLEVKIAEMQSVVETLKNLAKSCRGNNRPDCPILEDLQK